MKYSIKFSGLIFLLVLFSCHQEEHAKISYEGIKNFNIQDAYKASQESGKPILLYFNSYAGVNCRKMEMSFSSNGSITDRMQNDFVFIPLMVDDKTVANEKLWKQHPRRKTKMLKTVGALNNQLQYELIRYSSQPAFAIINDKKEVVSKIGYSSMDEFKEFLDEAE